MWQIKSYLAILVKEQDRMIVVFQVSNQHATPKMIKQLKHEEKQRICCRDCGRSCWKFITAQGLSYFRTQLA